MVIYLIQRTVRTLSLASPIPCQHDVQTHEASREFRNDELRTRHGLGGVLLTSGVDGTSRSSNDRLTGCGAAAAFCPAVLPFAAALTLALFPAASPACFEVQAVSMRSLHLFRSC